MSHVTDLNLHVKDLECLKKSGEELGMELVKVPQFKWFGTHVGDYPLPAGFKKEDMGKCEYALRIKGNPNAYEVGVCKRRDGKEGYALLWDFWAGGKGLQAAIGNDGSKLKQSYAAQVAKKHVLQLGRQGFRMVQYRKPDGTIFVKAVRG